MRKKLATHMHVELFKGCSIDEAELATLATRLLAELYIIPCKI
jgi:hypothetical protein